MDEQFSQEYIAFMLSDEAKVLREKWEPKEGDRFAMGDSYIGLVSHSWGRICTGTVWLPSLFQLIRIIEGAGWEWRRFGGLFLGWPHKPPTQEPIGFDDKDIMLAAAQLAARAVGGK